MSNRGVKHLGQELRVLIARMSQEYELSYAEVVGALELCKQGIADQCINGEYEEEDSEGEEWKDA